ncbi:Silent information regulator protein Sir2 [Arthrobacter crystallopoietes BAB-32]|uniref:NAD-dependent protein deacetylase n=1 Tax=Arthrobacter crystallopoietes BAB-32 TaxID=1246476 RepID=N1V2Z4_9MICC|nr:NAD-dependent protein deacetylase [Arthrobacter crystallopoietes]EMY34359.1 Silent information regulator protein Sir2 [Arthrobacter crystallopoietes BAB-32]
MDGQLRDVLEILSGRPLAVLTGAGLSTDSGIPDYRGPGSVPRNPMTYQQFVSDELLRRRYWARNHAGWRHMRRAQPNSGHFALAEIERKGVLTGLITQNVDRLHQAAGSRKVIDLHGRFDQVICLDCGTIVDRAALAVRLESLNEDWTAGRADAGDVAPDADADISDTDGFVVAACEVCGGMLKPDFVYFGENVPKSRVAAAYAMVDAAAALLVAGSSLTVMSGLRFVRHAAKQEKPVVIINRGQTRGDGLAAVKLEAGTSESLQALSAGLPGLAGAGSGPADWHAGPVIR